VRFSQFVLPGDSIFDDAAYVKGGPDVIRWLKAKLPDGWNATLCAVDGSMVQDVHRQLSRAEGCQGLSKNSDMRLSGGSYSNAKAAKVPRKDRKESSLRYFASSLRELCV
jgi:hypothetical protein